MCFQRVAAAMAVVPGGRPVMGRKRVIETVGGRDPPPICLFLCKNGVASGGCPGCCFGLGEGGGEEAGSQTVLRCGDGPGSKGGGMRSDGNTRWRK